ncbi:MAG: efflux RND transporter periplasmic adaptor subunit [Deltaproteobacteria bacterium]|nr:efflux RND transporter periplasmic adaptor subunit [Deltaproteobacteria bacterium]
MKKIIKPLAASVILIFIAAGIYSVFFKKTKEFDYIESTGIIEATEVELTSKIAGRIQWLCCREGDAIEAGAISVRIDNNELKARIEEARAAVVGAEQSVNEARVSLENAKVQNEAAKYDVEASQAEVERVRAIQGEARENLERAKGLFKDGFIAKKDLDAAQAAFDSNNAQLEAAAARRRAAEANLRNSAVNIKAARARISLGEAKKAQAQAQVNVLLAQLDDTEIASPISGVVVYKAFEAGEYVNPGASIYTIDDLKNIWARVDIEETQIQRIKLGSRAEIIPMGSEKVFFEAKVIEVSEVGGFATQRDVTRGRSDIKTFRVKAGIENAQGALKPGMTVTVRIHFK